MKFILILSLLGFGFSAYFLYDGYVTGTVINLSQNEYTSDANRKYSVEDSPILYWMIMAFLFGGCISSMWLPVDFYKKTSKINKQ